MLLYPFRALCRLLRRPRAADIVMLLVTATALAGCGGGAESATLGTAASTTMMSALGIGSAEASESGSAAWTACANEGQLCSFTGTQQVRYGTPTRYATLTLTDGTACSNAVFGDPAWGIVKSCWMAAPSTDTTTWTACADEGGTCAFAGTQTVRYGTDSNYVDKVLASGTACDNAVFGDPSYGSAKTCRVAADVATPGAPVEPVAPVAPVAPVTPVTPVTDPGPSGANPPIVLNATTSSRAGDVVSLQGESFGAAPRVYLESAASTPLPIVNSVGTGWLAVQIPSGATGALQLRIDSGSGVSARVALNAARPLHLDTLQLTPGGAFRVFGRNLSLAGSTPVVTVGGIAATVDSSKSDEHQLSVTAPLALAASSAATISVDNGNGSGPATLDRTIEALAGGSGDPFGLGVGWASGFGALAGTTIDAARDARLGQKVACNGASDDSGALQAAIELAAANGGGLVQLPAGQCLMKSGRMTLRSRVVVQGAGKAQTEIVYSADYPVSATGVDLAGLRNLTLTNSGAAEGPLLKDSTRVVIQNVRVRLTTSRQMYLSGNRLFAVVGSDFEQTGSIDQQGPYVLTDSSGLLFENNTTTWVDGAPTFRGVHDSYLHANRFSRDARNQNAGGGTVHSLVLDFAYRVAVVGNTLDVVNGPITNTTRNDGETILSEGGGAGRTENLGAVGSATATTMTDASNRLNVDPFGTGRIPENYGVAIVAGKGAGQSRRIVAYSQPTLTIDRAWDIVPDASSRYASFVWGLEKSLIKGNVLSQNPRGIWLYHTAIREVDVVANTISEGGGIYLRSYQNLAQKYFMPIWNVRIAGNRISNSNGRWMSYVNAVFVNADARAFGIANLGIEMRANDITANAPNVSSSWEEYAGMEGFRQHDAGRELRRLREHDDAAVARLDPRRQPLHQLRRRGAGRHRRRRHHDPRHGARQRPRAARRLGHHLDRRAIRRHRDAVSTGALSGARQCRERRRLPCPACPS